MFKEKVKQKYSLPQNIAYSLGNIWRWDKVYYAAYIPKIPINVFLPLAGIYFPKLLIDLITRKADDLTMLLSIGAYCIMLVIASLITSVCQSRINSTQYVFMLHYQGLCDKKNYTMDYENAENSKISDMFKHTYEGDVSAENLPKDLNGFLINLLGLFTYGSIIFAISPLIILLLTVTSVINYLMLTYVRNFTNKNADNWTHLDRKNNYLHNISSQYEHAKDVKLYGMQVWLSDLSSYYHSLRMAWHNKVFNKNLFATVVDGGLRFVRDGVAYAVLIMMLLDNRIAVGDFVFYFGAIAGFSEWLSSIVQQFNDLNVHNNNINRLRAYLEVENRFNYGKGVELPKKSEFPYDIEFKNITYTYPESEKPAINDISLKISGGEKLAVVGVNGAGKTTLVKLMCGLYYPTSGSVLLNGKDAREYNINEYYTQFSAVFQEIHLVPISIARFVSGDGDNVDREKVQKSLCLAGLDKVIRELPNGMDTTLVKGVYDDGIDLSGGEKQKLMLARALYKDAPVILLDEPTAALDPIAENELYLKYAELTKGKTAVYISHRLSSTRFCDRIIFIENGKIAECGSHDELMKLGGKYANMFEIQSHYYKEHAEGKR